MKDEEIKRLNRYIEFYEDVIAKQNKEIKRLYSIINENNQKKSSGKTYKKEKRCY